MATDSDNILNELGLPRANSNGLFFFALLVIIVFTVMAFSCNRERNKNSDAFDSPAQPLSGNEWFVGKARGIQIPEPPPAPLPATISKTQMPTARAQPRPPTKLLGGKVFGKDGGRASSDPELRPVQEQEQEGIASFNAQQGTVLARSARPEYYLRRDVEMPISDFEIKAGTVIPAQLDMGINSDLGGPAVAHVTRRIYDTVSGNFVLIPPGAKLYGNINPDVSFGQTRVDVIWERLIFPNGASLVIQNMRAADSAGQTGLAHTVDNHFDRLYGGAVLLSAISGGVQLSQPQQSANFGSAATVGQTLAGALGQNLGQVSTEFIRRQMDVRPTIIIPNGEHFTVTVSKDMVLPGPWGSWE